MPRANTTPVRRTKRDAEQKTSKKLARTAASVRAAAIANASARGSISAPNIKREPVPALIPPASVSAKPKSTLSSPPRGWRHPDELAYIRTPGKTWDDMAIVRFLTANAFSVPPRTSAEPWVYVRCVGVERRAVVLPRGYRLPLLWVAKFLWTSLKLVLTARPDIRRREWDGAKLEILHIARLCAELLARASAQMDEAGVIERGWRCAAFDRALHRYWHDWLIMRDEYLRGFFREFGEEEYQGDVLKLTWSRWVVKGHKGFTLTPEEAADGISAEEFMRGLVVDEDAGTFEWRESLPESRPEVQIPDSTVALPQAEEAQGDVKAAPTPKIQTRLPFFQAVILEAPRATAPAPSPAVSFLVRPRTAFRTASQRSPVFPMVFHDAQIDHSRTSTKASAAPPAIEVSVSPPAPQSHTDSPNDINYNIPMPADSTMANSPATRPKPRTYVQNSPVPSGDDDRIRRRASEPSGELEGAPMAMADQQSTSTSEMALDGEMQVDVDVPPKDAEPEEQMLHAPAYAPTTMGTRPGSAVLRRHSIDGSHGGGESGSVLVQQPEPQDEGEGEKEETEDGMSDVAPRSDAEGVVTDDLEFEEDLELLYPEQEVSQAGQDITPSASDSASRSISPVSPVPALSSARFPTAPAADGASTSTQLTVYPPGGQQLDGTDPGIASRFLQSCEGLGEEMHALRAEVAQLRAERAAPELQLEERVRRLEERSALAPPRPGLNGGTGRRWSHPLEHLMCANDSEMDVDARESPPGDGAVIMTKYGSVDGEPLPPRSRKFNGAPRFAAI